MLDNEVNEQEVKRTEIEYKVRLKNFLLQCLKSPFFIIGIILVVFSILIAFFPQILTPYTLAEALDFYPNPDNPDQLPYMPPSAEHPLGTTKFGRDLLALISWGTRDTLLVGFGAAFIGLLGGVIIGLIAGKFNLLVYRVILGLITIAFIVPAFILVLILTKIFGETNTIITVSLGILLIPSFTKVIANVTFRQNSLKNIIKTIITYIPLNVALGILLYVAVGFIGVNPDDWGLPQLSFYISEARAQLVGNPMVIFWPGFAIFMILIGFFFLHEGLKDQLQ
ncbi:MAG: ABC transporter permease [Promethearchaeota archaeon]